MKKSGEILSGFFSLYVRDLAGLSSGIRTHGLYHPKVARYQLRHTQMIEKIIPQPNTKIKS